MTDIYEIGDVLKEDENPSPLLLIVDKAALAGNTVYSTVRTYHTGLVSLPDITAASALTGYSRDKTEWGVDTLKERLEAHRERVFERRHEAFTMAEDLTNEIESLNVYIGRLNEKEEL